MIRAGRMSKSIVLEKPVRTRSSAGKVSTSWLVMGTAHCQFVDTNAREFMVASQLNSSMTHMLRIRFRKDVDSTWRAKFGTKVFNFDSVIDPGMGGRELTIQAVQESA